MSGRPRGVKKTLWSIRVPVDLAEQVDAYLLDPVAGRSRYGGKSGLVERLLRNWLEQQKQQRQQQENPQ